MRVDLSSKILGLDGLPIKEGDKDFTLCSACCGALLAHDPKESDISGEEKVRRFKLAEKAYAGGLQDLSVEDVALLKTLISRSYTTLVVGRAFDLLDPKPKE